MVVLNIYGRIDPICISKKLGLYISNLPQDEGNNWQEMLAEELQINMKCIELQGGEKSTTNIMHLYSKVFSGEKIPSDNERLMCKKLAHNMIRLYFDYKYEDMPLGGWETNCFDGRLCEEDCAEKVLDFLQFLLDEDDALDKALRSIPTWIYSTNYDVLNSYRFLWGGQQPDKYIYSLKAWGKLIDSFLETRNDYLFLNYLFNSLHKDNEYNEYHLLKSYSLCQLFFEGLEGDALDERLTDYMDKNRAETNRKRARLFRQLRNKIAHGCFAVFEKKAEEYAQEILDGYMKYDYAELSRQNWVLLNACCELDSILRRLILAKLYKELK